MRVPVLSRIRNQAKESLFRNSASLILNTGMGAISGYASLALIVHVYSVQAIGLSATAMSEISLVVAITQFGVNLSLPRYLPTIRRRNVAINTLLTAMLVGTAITAIVFLVLPVARPLFALGGLKFGLAFTLFACIQASVGLLGAVLVADRKSDKLAVANAIPNVLKLGMPFAFAFLGGLGAFASRAAGGVLVCVILIWMLTRSGHRFKLEFNHDSIREIRRFSFGAYIANLIGGLPMLLLPVIVLGRIGAKGSAYWAVAISVGILLYQVPSSITQALLPELSHRPKDRRRLLIRSARMIHLVMIPLLLIAYVAAPVPLMVLGHSYVSESIPALRWIIIAGLSTGVNYIAGAILFLAKKTTQITVVNAVNAVIVLGMAGVWARTATQVAIGWAIGDAANVVLFGFAAYLAIRAVGGRLEALGGEVASVIAKTTVGRAAALQESLDLLAMIAERQRVDTMQEAYRYQLTEPQGLYSVLAYQEAEWDRLERSNE